MSTEICRNCGRAAERLDGAGWCDDCRDAVVARATKPAWAATLLLALLAVLVLWWAGAFASRFLVVWLAVAAGVAYVGFKVARRVAFEVVRARWSARTRG